MKVIVELPLYNLCSANKLLHEKVSKCYCHVDLPKAVSKMSRMLGLFCPSVIDIL